MTQNHFWYQADKDKVHEQVFKHVCGIQEYQVDVDRKNRDLSQFYSNREEPGIHNTRGIHRSPFDGVTENLIASVVDTATSLIAKSRPKVSVLTDNAEWSLQRTARRLEHYNQGQFDALNVYDKMQQMFRDACIFGTGFLHPYVHNGEIKVDRVLPTEIVVDEDTCRSSPEPLEMHRVRLVSKTVLKKKFARKSKVLLHNIDNSSCGVYDYRYTRHDLDLALVIESWRLARGSEGKGRYTMVVEGATLVDEDYGRDWFPFVTYRWSPPLTGYYGQGLAEYLLPYQVRVDELNDFIQKCQDLIAVPRVFVEAGSKMLKLQMDNEIGIKIPYVGTPPTFFTPQALNAEIYAYKEQLKSSAFEFAGISKMAAQATRPEGIEAAVALRELSDNQSQRFSIQQSRYEQVAVDLAKMFSTLARGMGNKAPSVFLAKSFVETIDWPSVDFDKNRFVFNLQPSSLLGESPAGRLQRIVELAQYGVPIKPQVMQRLLAHPDIALEDSRSTSAVEYAEWIVEQLQDGEWIEPDAFMDLVETLDRLTAALREAIMQKAPEDILDNMRQWSVSAFQKLEAAQAPPPAVGPDGVPLAGNVGDTGLPGVLDPTQVDTAQTLAPGLIENAPLT